jgi:hypothetical protein
MAKEDSVNWSDLKKLLKGADQEELINLLHDLYKHSVDNRRYITARYVKGDESRILEAYRKKVITAFSISESPV